LKPFNSGSSAVMIQQQSAMEKHQILRNAIEDIKKDLEPSISKIDIPVASKDSVASHRNIFGGSNPNCTFNANIRHSLSVLDRNQGDYINLVENSRPGTNSRKNYGWVDRVISRNASDNDCEFNAINRPNPNRPPLRMTVMG
jgi:hypothetical protein